MALPPEDTESIENPDVEDAPLDSCKVGYEFSLWPADPSTDAIWLANTFFSFAAFVTGAVYIGLFLLDRHYRIRDVKRPLRFVDIVKLLYAGITIGITLPVCLYPYLANAFLSCRSKGGMIVFLKIVEMFSTAFYVGIVAILPFLTALSLVAGNRLGSAAGLVRNWSMAAVAAVQAVLMILQLATCEVLELYGGLYPFIYGLSQVNTYSWGVVLYDGFFLIVPCLIVMFLYQSRHSQLQARDHPLRGLFVFSLANGVIYVVSNVTNFAAGFMGHEQENYFFVSALATLLATVGLLFHMWYLIYDLKAQPGRAPSVIGGSSGGQETGVTKTKGAPETLERAGVARTVRVMSASTSH